MAAIIKATWFFKGADYGWTESLFLQQATLNLGQAQVTAKLLAEKRRVMLGKDYMIHAIRVSVVQDPVGTPVTRQFQLDYVNLPATTTKHGLEPQRALLFIMRSANGQNSKFVFLRGIWEAAQMNNGVYVNNNADFNTAWGAWIGLLIQQGWGWIKQSPVLPDRQVLDYTQLVDERVSIVVTANTFAAPFGVGMQEVRLTGVNVKGEINGRRLIRPINANTCELVKPLAVGPFVSVGKIRLYTTSLVQAAAGAPQKLVNRKPGKPSLVIRGRAPVQPTF